MLLLLLAHCCWVFFETQWLQCSLVYGGDTAAGGSLLLVVCVLFSTQRLQCSLVNGDAAAAVGSLLLGFF